MKQIGLYMLLICLIWACQKEDKITPNIGYENLYTIHDDPNDSIQHKRYELYKKYGVPIYFNDTIGKVFVKLDINGDSVFHHETLDLNWTFSGSNAGSVTYQVTRIKDPGLMMKSLRFAEIFLERCQPALYPYALWLTDKCYQLSSEGVIEKDIISRYRNLMFSWIDRLKKEDMPDKSIEYRNEVVKLKVQNYENALKSFNIVVDESMYEKTWFSIYPQERLPYWSESGSSTWYPWPMEEEWAKDKSYRQDMTSYGNYTHPDWPQGVWTDEDVDNYTEYCRSLVGAIGFVCYDAVRNNSKFTPANTDVDLELYLDEMLKYNRKQFMERWESSPLVLKKYEILYAIIRDELGVEL